MRICAIWIVILISSFSVKAQLNWKDKKLSGSMHQYSPPKEFRFEFSNVSGKPISITKVIPSCGCTVVELDKKLYNPGESGVIIARFSHNGKIGTQSKKIMVKTDYKPKDVHILNFDATVYPCLELRRVDVDLIERHSIRLAVKKNNPDAKIIQVVSVDDTPLSATVNNMLIEGVTEQSIEIGGNSEDLDKVSVLEVECIHGTGVSHVLKLDLLEVK